MISDMSALGPDTKVLIMWQDKASDFNLPAFDFSVNTTMGTGHQVTQTRETHQ